MSSNSVVSSKSSKESSRPGAGNTKQEDSTSPDFIYGGPFIKVEKPEPFFDTATPVNLLLQGTFKKSFAYYSLKGRLPIILTKVIDYLSRDGSRIKSTHNASDEDIRGYIQYITKLKNDLLTNKKYDLLTVDTPEANRWNEWILSSENSYYFTNTWVFSECYVYRRLREGCELSKSLKNFDPFEEQKEHALKSNIELMCVVADKLVTMLPASGKDKRKADFVTLLKICLWANKCDLSLSMGEPVSFTADGNATKSQTKVNVAPVIDPFQMIIDLKEKLLVDDSAKIADQVIAKAENMGKAVEGPPPELPIAKGSASSKGSPEPASPTEPEEGVELPKVPCPAKMTTPQAVIFDIVCDNSAYELFSDVCVAHFLVSQKIVQKVRFHVKKIPWFVSDVTPRDFNYLLQQCKNATYRREVPSDPAPEGAAEPRVVTSDNLRTVAQQWQQYIDDGTFIVMCDDFWTSPHVFKDMKRYDSDVYRKLQFAVAVLFKGDLNYRKLLGEKNWNPTTGFETALQGFTPAPVIALRTVKADLICGLPKGKYEQLSKINEKWMETGDYGLIQFCPKSEPLKAGERPCPDYGDTCFGTVCPTHTDL
ncbi:damage-control phosphatase ARMT1-like isoform X2 [Galleria mellonella]|uniref:Sugar phosphate phosphatase n=1 Tax=Galleria mellonella TaxID=7137 RepID=A0ABM3MA59_GALME|nr:damage-control phosphatase ARMT1-like isoform X2 [Galleria mellonella]